MALKEMPVGLKLLCSCIASSALLPSVHYILLLVLIKSSFAKRWLRLEGKVTLDLDLGEPFLIAMYVFTLSVETLPSPCQT